MSKGGRPRLFCASSETLIPVSAELALGARGLRAFFHGFSIDLRTNDDAALTLASAAWVPVVAFAIAGVLLLLYGLLN